MLCQTLAVVFLSRKVYNWFHKRNCSIQLITIALDLLSEADFEHSILENIELNIYREKSFDDIKCLQNTSINQKVSNMKIKHKQDPAVMEVLFSLLSNSSVRSLEIEYSNNLSQWMEHIKKIGLCLREIGIHDHIINKSLTTITEYCPYLEKLSLTFYSVQTDNNILQIIARNCPHLRSLDMWIVSPNSPNPDADLTAFVEKCNQLEELSLSCRQLTDQSVIALAQHCSRLKKLKLSKCKLTVASLIALSERGLPLDGLDIIPWIPIPSAEIAAQCAHALSRIPELNSHCYGRSVDCVLYALQYMTGLRKLYLDKLEDHLLVPHLLLLLQGQCCAGLESLNIYSDSSITAQQLSELVSLCPQLHTLQISKPTCTSDTVLLKLAHSCPHLQKIILDGSWPSTVADSSICI